MKRALICGVNGQDGAYLAKLLLDKGYEVVGTSRDAQVSTFGNLQRLGIHGHVRTFSMALNDFRSVLRVLSAVEPDEIYNLSGPSSVGLSFELPVETMEIIGLGTLNLLEAIRFLRKRSRFYNAGTSECFGDTLGHPADEETPFRPRSPYAVAKCTAHWQVANYREAYGIFACTGILFNHESSLRPTNFVTKKIVEAARSIANGSKEHLVLGNTKVIRDWGWAPEYVEAMWRMMQMDSPDDFVIATGISVSLEYFAELVFTEFGLDWRSHTDIKKELFRPTDLAVSRADAGKAVNRLQWQAKYNVNDVAKLMVAERI